MMENVVVDGPIDRLGLANNLFATGEYPMALEMYQEAAKSELTAQQHFWVEYQTANCLRRLGKPAEASQRYRKLADHPEAGWLSHQARWWVETQEKIRSLEKTLADNAFDHHRAIVEEVEHAASHSENPPAPSATDSSPHKEATQDDHAH
jgi:tetratricopeptide (TPR) repeat protein